MREGGKRIHIATEEGLSAPTAYEKKEAAGLPFCSARPLFTLYAVGTGCVVGSPKPAGRFSGRPAAGSFPRPIGSHGPFSPVEVCRS